MRTITNTITAYKFAELSSKAQQKVIDARRETCAEYFSDNAECVMDDAKQIAAMFGLEIDKVYYSGFSSQGDGACFEGRYSYVKGALKAVKQYAPQDVELHRIVADLQNVQRKNFYQLWADTCHSGYYQHSGCMHVDVYHNESNYRDVGSAEDDIAQCLREFADWIYTQLEEEYGYQSSEELAREEIAEFDEYLEYTEDGRIV